MIQTIPIERYYNLVVWVVIIITVWLTSLFYEMMLELDKKKKARKEAILMSMKDKNDKKILETLWRE